jgi:hypothetical protein
MGSMQCNVEFGYQLSICFGTKENLDRVANWLLANSPALNPRALILVPICAVMFFSCFLFFFLLLFPSFLTSFFTIIVIAPGASYRASARITKRTRFQQLLYYCVMRSPIGPSREHRFQQFYCCVPRLLFTEPSLNNDRCTAISRPLPSNERKCHDTVILYCNEPCFVSRQFTLRYRSAPALFFKECHVCGVAYARVCFHFRRRSGAHLSAAMSGETACQRVYNSDEKDS